VSHSLQRNDSQVRSPVIIMNDAKLEQPKSSSVTVLALFSFGILRFNFEPK
jgi:hypothetical protein